MWVLPFPGLRGLGDGSVAGPNGAKGWVRARTQRGLGLGPFVFGPNGVWVRVLPCPNPKGCGIGSESGPKGFEFRVSVQTQNGFWCGSFPIRTQEGWGLGPSMAEPKSV